MLRECLTVNDQLVKILLNDEKRRFYSIFEYVNHDAFDIASDAFRTFRVSNFQFLWTFGKFRTMRYMAYKI